MSEEEGIKKIVEASEMILNVCDGAIERDEEGYDFFDARYFRGFLTYPEIFGVEGLTPEEVEWMRRKLLRYKGQLSEMGFDTDVLDEPVHSEAFFAHAKDWRGNHLRLSPRSLGKILDGWLVEALEEWDGGLKIELKFYKSDPHPEDHPLKRLWVRFNDPDENGKSKEFFGDVVKNEQ